MSPSDIAARSAIAAAFVRSSAKTMIERAAGKAWLWSGPWLKLALEESKPGAASEGNFWRDVQTIVDASHDAAPLVEVVYWGAHADAAKPAAKPSAGPVYGVTPPSFYGQKRDAKLPAPTEDPTFTKALATRMR